MRATTPSIMLAVFQSWKRFKILSRDEFSSVGFGSLFSIGSGFIRRTYSFLKATLEIGGAMMQKGSPRNEGHALIP